MFENTHPAIIDRETFALVQELRQHRRRPTKSGIVSMFSGIFYCADCGEKLFAQKQLENFGEQKKAELAEKRRELNKANRRIREIDSIIQKLYEDNAMGKINDDRFVTMSMSLENEQDNLKASVTKV